jgi:hypothetical protein
MLYQRTKDPRLAEQTKRFEAVKAESARNTAENLRAVEVRRGSPARLCRRLKRYDGHRSGFFAMSPN